MRSNDKNKKESTRKERSQEKLSDFNAWFLLYLLSQKINLYPATNLSLIEAGIYEQKPKTIQKGVIIKWEREKPRAIEQ